MKTKTIYSTVCALLIAGFAQAQSDSSTEKKTTIVDGKNVKITLETKIISDDSGKSAVVINGDTMSDMSETINQADKEIRRAEKIIEEEKVIINDDENHYIKNKSSWLNFDLGFNFLAHNGTLDMPEEYKDLELENGKGCNFNLRIYEQSIDIIQKHLYLMYGAGIDWNTYRFKNNVDLQKDSSPLAYSINNINNYSKNKLVSTYITVPIMIKVRFKENKDGDAFQICLGPQFGYLINSYQKQKWEENGNKNKQKTRGDFNLNEFRIGYQMYFGYKNIQFYARYYPTSTFKTNKGPDVNTVSVGLAFGGFNNKMSSVF